MPSRKPLRADTAVDLQPVIIYYRTYAPVAIVKSSEPNVKQTAAAPIKQYETGANPSPRTVPKQAERSIAPSDSYGPANLAERRKSADVGGSVRQEIAPAKLSESVNGTLAVSPKQPLSEPIAKTDSAMSPGQPAVNKPPTETADLIVEKTVEKPAALGAGNVESPLQKADTSQQTLAKDAAASGLTSTPPSATMPEETTPAASTVVETPKLKSGTLPAATSAGLETESGSLDAIGLNNLAVRLSIENQNGEAIALLERAIEADATVAKFHRNLSIAFEQMKQFDKALASARTAAKLAPADPSILEQLCEMELITANTTAAIGCYEKLRSIVPLDALGQTYYGIALFKSGKEEESIKILEQAARSTPPIAEAMNVLGVVYYKRKQFDNAVSVLKNAVETSPDVLEMRYNLALAQLARGNKAAAISQYNIIKTGDRKLADQLYRVLQGDRVVSVSDMMRSKR
jgi:Flp pilus assembly protein TadD